MSILEKFTVIDLIKTRSASVATIPGIYFAEDDALVYDVGAAYKPSQKGGWTAKRMKEGTDE